jgi:Rod binding domain-containing protein
MIDQNSAISSQHSALTGNAYKARDNKIQDLEPGPYAADVKSKKDDFKKIAKEMESLFAYQLLKIMRETTGKMSDDKKENGYDTYMGLFDMEVSKLFADRGLGLQDSIINWLERSPGVNEEDVGSRK